MRTRARVLALLRAHGWNATSFQVLETGFSYWFDPAHDACVAYVDTGRAWVAAGGPIASDADLAATTLAFARDAMNANRRAAFFAVEARFTNATNFSSMPIGEQPSWDPTCWEETVRTDRSLKEQLRRARVKGVRVRALMAQDFENREIRPHVDELIASWLAARKMAPMGFLVDVQPFAFAEERRSFVAEHDGRIVGLLAAVPVFRRHGWLFEDLIRDSHAPNGTSEMLIDAAMRTLAKEQCRYVTLGLAPLSGPVEGWLRLARACSAALYDFDGLRRFKAKLRPQAWTSIHLSWPPEHSGNVALYDALAAFTMRGHSRASFVRFGLETLAHAPAFAVRALGVLLVPWTVALALPAATRLFPSRTIQLSWCAFDGLLACAMFELAARWRHDLARALAAAILADATLTLAEVMFDGAGRVQRPGDVVFLLAACIGPLLATSLLWNALRVRPLRKRS